MMILQFIKTGTLIVYSKRIMKTGNTVNLSHLWW